MRKENGPGCTYAGTYLGSSELLCTSVVFVVCCNSMRCANDMVVLDKEEEAFHSMTERLI